MERPALDYSVRYHAHLSTGGGQEDARTDGIHSPSSDRRYSRIYRKKGRARKPEIGNITFDTSNLFLLKPSETNSTKTGDTYLSGSTEGSRTSEDVQRTGCLESKNTARTTATNRTVDLNVKVDPAVTIFETQRQQEASEAGKRKSIRSRQSERIHSIDQAVSRHRRLSRGGDPGTEETLK